MNMILSNAETIEQELEWFQELILLRGKIIFEQSVPDEDLDKLSIHLMKIMIHNMPG